MVLLLETRSQWIHLLLETYFHLSTSTKNHMTTMKILIDITSEPQYNYVTQNYLVESNCNNNHNPIKINHN